MEWSNERDNGYKRNEALRIQIIEEHSGGLLSILNAGLGELAKSFAFLARMEAGELML